MHKQCRECLAVKPLDEFYIHSRMADGHLNKCKSCVKKRVVIHRENNITQIRIYDNARSGLPERKAQRAAHQVWYRQHRHKQYMANRAVSNALRDGRIVKKCCEICGNSNSEAHHHDYDNPLDVIWLCTIHHRRLHHKKFSLVPF